MKNVGILTNDLLAVHLTSQARNGQIVVARLEDDVTVKRFHKKGHRVRLSAENPEFQTIHVDLRTQSLSIEGLVVGVLRNRQM